jgi:hypothetical protein
MQNRKKIKSIFDGMDLCLELGINKSNIPLLHSLISSLEEFDDFITNFWGQSECQGFDIANFRAYKLNKMKVSFTRLEQVFGQNPQLALEELTQRPVHKNTTNEIVNGIANGKFTLMTIFDKFMSNKDLSLSRILLDI